MDMGYFIRNSLGFFAQLFPCVLLCCLPFDRWEWKLRWNRVLVLFLGVCGGSALLFPFAVKRMEPLRMEVVGNLYMAAVVILCSALFLLLLTAQWYKKLLIICVVLYYALTQYMLVNFALGFLVDTDQSELYTVTVLTLYFVTILMLFPLFYWVLRYIQAKFLVEWGKKEIRSSLLIVSFLTIVYVVTMCLSSTLLFLEDGNRTVFMDILEMVIYLIVGCLFIYLYRLSFWKIARVEKEEKRRQEMEMQEIQYRKISGEIEQARRQRHDLRHHMRALTVLLEEGKVPEALAHIAKVYDQNEEIDLEQFCKNVSLNAILSYYVKIAREQGIDCHVQAEMPEGLLDSVDLTVVFGNCLENAIEASRQTEEKYLSVEVGVVSHAVGVKIENSSKGLETEALEGSRVNIEKLKSSKKQGGIGLKSVEQILKKYDSAPLHCEYDEKRKRFLVHFLWYCSKKEK